MIAKQTYRQFATVREEMAHEAVVHVFGDVDLSSASDLDAAIAEAAGRGVTIVVNFERCCYMDSTGLSVLVRAVTRYGPRVRAVVAEHSVIARLLRITDFEKVLPISFSDG